MKKLSQNVWRTDDGGFLVRVTARRPDGKRDEVERTFPDRKIADQFVRDWKVARAYAKEGLRAQAVVGGLTVRDLFEKYLAEIEALGRSKEHARTVRRVQRFVEAALGPNARVPLTRDEYVKIAAYGTQRTRTKGDQTRKAFSMLKTAHRRQGLPVVQTPEIRVERMGRRAPDDAKMLALIAVLPLASPVRGMAEMMLRTGCREAEALRLRACDVDFERGTVTFETRKGPRSRRVGSQTVPMTVGLRRALGMYTSGSSGEEPFFFQKEGRFMQHTSLRRALERASVVAGIVPAMTGLGWIRNRVATLMGDAGVRVEVSSRVLGHESVKTTEGHYDSSKLWAQRVEGLAALEALLDAKERNHFPTGARSPQGNAQDELSAVPDVATKVTSGE